MKLKRVLFTGVLAMAAAGAVFVACSDDQGFLGNGNIAWSNGGSSFNGAFGWDDGDVNELALFSGTSCDSLDSSVDIVDGFSQDPCAQETNEDGTPFDGTIDGIICNADDDTQVAHTVTCDSGEITDITQDVSFFADMVLYRTEDTVSGNLGGRTGADALCVADKPEGVSQPYVRAFISVSETDEVRDMPGNYGVPTSKPIVGVNDVQIGDNWADLLDGSIDATLVSAGFEEGKVTEWGGTTPDGSFDVGENCSGWTSTEGTGSLIFQHVTTDWLASESVNNCSSTTQSYVVCLAY